MAGATDRDLQEFRERITKIKKGEEIEPKSGVDDELKKLVGKLEEKAGAGKKRNQV